MLSVTVKMPNEFLKACHVYEKQSAFMISHALTRSASHGINYTKPRMDKLFDGGATRWTKTGMSVEKATKSKLQSAVYMKGNRASYVYDLIKGGTRKPQDSGTGKRKNIPNPVKGGAKVNKYGNFPRNRQKNLLDKKRDKGQSKRGTTFAGIPKGFPQKEKYLGIWERQAVGRRVRTAGGGITRKGAKLKMLISWSKQRPQKPTNAQQIPYLLMRGFDNTFERQFVASFRYAMRSARVPRTPTGF